jgi:YD repeat-containing protein
MALKLDLLVATHLDLRLQVFFRGNAIQNPDDGKLRGATRVVVRNFGYLWALLASLVQVQSVIAGTTVTTLTTTSASISAGQLVNFVATVNGNSPTGLVQFKDGTANLGVPVGLTSGVASFSTSGLTVGNHVLTAAYLGDINNFGSTSVALTEIVVNPFSAAAAMTTARVFHTATQLPNGKVLVVAGQGSAGYLASAELYDPRNNNWQSAGALIVPRRFHTATLLPSGKVLVAGGFNDAGYVKSAQLYDPAANSWSPTADLPMGRAGHTATLLPSGKVLVAGGFTDSGAPANEELYDPSTNTWSPAAVLSPARLVHTATLLPSGKVLVAGGLNFETGYSNNAVLYDPATNQWSPAKTLGMGRGFHTATLLLTGEVLVAGGGDTNNSAELYDPIADKWSAAGTLVMGRGQHTATLLPNGKVLVVAGFDNVHYLNSAELYDRATNTWSAAGTLTAERQSPTATLLSIGKVLVAGGDNSTPSIYLNSTELDDFDAPHLLPPDPSTVAPPVAPGVATTVGASTSFLYSSSNPIQVGVLPGTIVPQHASVIRGKVLDNVNAPLAGVKITILNHPEFGQTLSRSDGMFDLAVNGGAPVIVKYEKSGLISSQRQVQVSWGDYANAPDVVLIPQDTQVTTLDLTSNIPVQSARGTQVNDSHGTRQATVLFPNGTQATMLLPDGTNQPLTKLSVRATEFTVGPDGPNAMPGDLPPTSGYTYAVDFGVDEATVAGATRITFAKPIFFYVENFLNYQVGANVPIGSYDTVRGTWIPSDDGKIVNILSVQNGEAQIDTTGAGVADNGVLLASPITLDERKLLATLYPNPGPKGQSLWRGPINHFSSYDWNWCYSLPPDAIRPDNANVATSTPVDNCCTSGNSIIESQNQILGETIPIVGTPFSLNYRSDRVPGRPADQTLNIKLIGSTIPVSLKHISLIITVGGRVFAQTFPSIQSPSPIQPNQTVSWTWDRKDVYGRTLNGKQPVSVAIAYVYPGFRDNSGSESGGSFGGAGGGGASTGPQLADPALQQIVYWRNFHVALGSWQNPLGGWSLSPHHGYDVINKMLYLGDGTKRSSAAVGLNATINTVATNLDGPFGVAAAADGSLYIAETSHNQILRIGPNGGTPVVVAGNGIQGLPSSDGGPATQTPLNQPMGVALGLDGSFYIVDAANNLIRRVTNGTIHTVAGNLTAGYNGDGILATNASLNLTGFGTIAVSAVAIGPDDSIYIADSANNLIRRVAPNGFISIVAGKAQFPSPPGNAGNGGDGGLATQAHLSAPSSIAVDRYGFLYIVDSGNNRVRRVGPDGIITNFAGNGKKAPLSSGDGGPATQAFLQIGATGIAVGPDGSVFFGDIANGRIRRVGPDGIITTVAGGDEPPNGLPSLIDGGPATGGFLGFPRGIAIDPDGSLLFADEEASVRKVSAQFPGYQLSNFLVASEDGNEVYMFNGDGLHQRTVNALTGAVVFSFSYDANGHLSQVTDGDQNVTTINYDTNGNPKAIVGPFGQTTVLSVDANGYLNRVTDPLGQKFEMISASNGLLTTFTDPNTNRSTIFYEPDTGRLKIDTDAAGGSKQLTRTDSDQSSTWTLITGLGRTTTYTVDNQPKGDERRVNVFPDKTQTELLIGTDGRRKTTFADSTVSNLLQGPDPRFSMETPLPKMLTTTTGTLTSTVSMVREVSFPSNAPNPPDLTKIATQIDTTTINNQSFKRTFDAQSKTFTSVSAAGRTNTVTIDDQGRVIQAQVKGLGPVNLSYSAGKLSTITQVSGTDPTDKRIVTFAYWLSGPLKGYLKSVTDPLNPPLQFLPDAGGRVKQLTLPDGSPIAYSYDANGNLKSVTPPGGPAHGYDYNAVNLVVTNTETHYFGIRIIKPAGETERLESIPSLSLVMISVAIAC